MPDRAEQREAAIEAMAKRLMATPIDMLKAEPYTMAKTLAGDYEESMGPMVPLAEVERWLDHGLMDAPRTREVMLAAFRREFSPTERGSE